MKKLFTRFILSIALTAPFAANAQNANSQANQSVQLGLSNAIELTFVGGSSTVSIPFLTLSDLVNGVSSPDQNILVRSNRPFKVAVATNSANFNYTGSSLLAPLLSGYTAIRLKVSNNNTGGTGTIGSWLLLNILPTSAKTILNNCSAGGNQTFAVSYKLIPGATLPSGSYNIDMVFTATQL